MKHLIFDACHRILFRILSTIVLQQWDMNWNEYYTVSSMVVDSNFLKG